MKKYTGFLLCLIFILISLSYPFLAQTTERKKAKIKNFGSSLEKKDRESLAQNRGNKGEGPDDEVIKINTNLVVLDCLVVDEKGNIMTGLKPEDFSITEDTQPQEIITFSLGDDAKVPRSIVLIIDYSGSQKPYLERSVEAAKLLVDKLRPNDLMAIVTDDVEIIAQFTADKKKLKKELDSLRKPGFFSNDTGASKQFSALYAVLNEMFDETDIRPIIIFQTDGDELLFLKGEYGDSIFPRLLERKVNFSAADLQELIGKSRASIYSVFPGVKLLGLTAEEKKVKLEKERIRQLKYFKIDPAKLPPPTPEQVERRKQIQKLMDNYYPKGVPDPQEFMSNLSQQAGGWLEFLEEPEQADGIYTRILSELNTRYIIGYSSANETRDGKRRTIKVEIKGHPEYKVLGKTSYLAPPPE